MNQENELYKKFNKETTKTLKIKSVAHDSLNKFKNFFTLGLTGIFGVGLLSVFTNTPLDYFIPIFTVAIMIPTYYGVKAIVTHNIAEESEKNLLNTHKNISEKLIEIREKFNKNEELNILPKI